MLRTALCYENDTDMVMGRRAGYGSESLLARIPEKVHLAPKFAV